MVLLLLDEEPLVEQGVVRGQAALGLVDEALFYEVNDVFADVELFEQGSDGLASFLELAAQDCLFASDKIVGNGSED